MVISENKQFIEAIQKCIDFRQPIQIAFNNEELKWSPCSSYDLERDLNSLKNFSQYLLNFVKVHDLRMISEGDMQGLQNFIALYEDLIKFLSKIHKNHKARLLENSDYLMEIKLGGGVPLEAIRKSDCNMMKLIKENRLDQAFSRLGIQLEYSKKQGIAIPVEYKPHVFRGFYWDDFTIQEEKTPLKIGAVRVFFYKNHFLFKTDKNLRLQPQFNCFYKGIMQYDPSNSYDLFPYNRRDPSEWGNKHIVSILSWKEPKAGYQVEVRDDLGNLYNICQKRGKIYAPDERFFSKRWGKTKKITFAVTKEEWKGFKKYIESARFFRAKVQRPEFLLKQVDIAFGIDVLKDFKVESKYVSKFFRVDLDARIAKHLFSLQEKSLGNKQVQIFEEGRF